MEPVTLHTYAVSQSSEKVRWALDLARIPYRERRLTPFVQGTSVTAGLISPMPVLEADGQTIGDSTRILEWLAVHRAPFPLIPRDATVRAAVMSAESRYDQMATHLLRWTYAGLLRHRKLALTLWGLDANLAQKAALRAAFPLIRRVFERGLDFRPAALERSARMIDRFIAELDRVVESGRPYVEGGRLSVADITAAALLAPIACPDEHPVYCRGDYEMAMAEMLEPWDRRPGLQWVRLIYRQHRAVARTAPRPAKMRLAAT